MSEIWKDIEEYEGLYQVSNMGRVKSLKFEKEKILKQSSDSNGYLHVIVSDNNKRKNYLVHRLVANAFIPNIENKLEVDHINTIRDDNRVDNLRWCTHKENMNNDASRKKNSDRQKGSNSSSAKQVKCNNTIYGCIKDCANKYGVARCTMSNWLNGSRKMPQKYIDLGLTYIEEVV